MLLVIKEKNMNNQNPGYAINPSQLKLAFPMSKVNGFNIINNKIIELFQSIYDEEAVFRWISEKQ